MMMYLISALVTVSVISFVMGYDYGRFKTGPVSTPLPYGRFRTKPTLLSYDKLEFNARFPKSDTVKRWTYLVNRPHSFGSEHQIRKIGDVYIDKKAGLLVDFEPKG